MEICRHVSMPFTISMDNTKECGKSKINFQALAVQLSLSIRHLCHLRVISIKTMQECGKPKNTFQGSV